MATWQREHNMYIRPPVVYAVHECTQVGQAS